jgi:iron complex transport system substrate-binding protein
MRIVSLLPAATEIVAHLGLRDQLVGVSHACQAALRDHAARHGDSVPTLTQSRVPLDLDAAETDACVRDLLRRGEPLFELDEELLIALRPDVILSQSLCNVCAIDGNRIASVARKLGPTTRLVEWSPTTLEDVVNGIGVIGDAVNASASAREAMAAMRRELFAACQSTCIRSDRPRVVFLEWVEPLFCAGHWIPELIELAGGVEVIGTAGARSRTIQPADLIAADPDVIIACCCGWSAERTLDTFGELEQQHWWQSLQAVRQGRVHVIDAESSFTTPGPGLVAASRLLAQLMHGRSQQSASPALAAAT